MSSYCIIGGTGFLGTALRHRLQQDNHEVIVVGRKEQAEIAPSEQYISSVEFDAFIDQARGDAISAIIDMAYTTVPSTSVDDPVSDFSSNLRSVLRHLDATRRLGATRYVFVSSGGAVYGDQGLDRIPEDAPNQPVSPYGITKLACEQYTLLQHRLHRLPSLVVRPSNVYGPGQQPFRGQGLVATALGAALRGNRLTVFGDGSNIRDFLYVDDFCSGLFEVLMKGVPGEIYNIGSGQGRSVREVLSRVNQVVEADGYGLEVEWQEGRPYDVQRNVLDVGKLQAMTGWQVKVPFEAGLVATWEWIKRLNDQ